MPRQTNIQVRRGSIADWNTADPILNPGELGWDSSNKILKIGDGSNFWSHKKPISPYFSTYKTDIGDGVSSSFTINHNLDATTETFVKVRSNSTGEQVQPDIKYVDKDNVLVEFASAPSVDEYSVTIVGMVVPSSEPSIVTNGLVLNLDAANTDSYPGSGTTWYDLSGNEYNGTLINGPTFSSANSGSFSFDGTNDYSYSSLSLNNLSMTLEVVFKVNSGAESWRDIAVLDAGSSSTSIILEIGGNNGSSYTDGYLRYYGVGMGLASNDLASANQYIRDYEIHYATLTIDSANSIGKSYFDGSLEGTSTFTGSSIDFSRLTLANDLTRSGRYAKVNIYHAKLYDRALSADEILSNYNATKSRYGL